MQAIADKHFSRGEADRLVGRRVRAHSLYGYVPDGTTGQIVRAEEVTLGRFALVVEFDDERRQNDWFTRAAFQQFLTEA